MSRPVAPCGTFTAYKRHKRRGEPVDEACAAAAREQKNSRVEAQREEVAAVVQLAIAEAPEVVEVDPLAEARDTLRMLKAAMESGAPGMAALAKQRMELVAQIARLESASKPRESKLDELARRRADRIAAAQA